MASARRLGVFILAIGLVSCERGLEPPAPPGPISRIDGKPLDAGRLAALEAAGEGCAVTRLDPDGSARGFAVPRARLPFTVPPISRSGLSRIGNGRAHRVEVVDTVGRPVIMMCWVPASLGVEQMAQLAVKTSDPDAWQRLFDALEMARPWSYDISRQLYDREAREFTSLMLAADTGAAVPASGLTARDEECHAGPMESRRPKGAPASDTGTIVAREDWCSCFNWTVTISGNGGNWEINVFFSYCNGNTGTDYGSMIGGGYWQWPCGGNSYDERDGLRALYTQYQASYIPGCNEFLYQPSTPHFDWPLIRSHGAGESWNYALLRTTIHDGLEQLWAKNQIVITSNNRVYSTPKHQADIYDAAGISPRPKNSRHIYGDAADIHSADDTVIWQAIRDTAYHALNPRPCMEPWTISRLRWVHIDYRTSPFAVLRFTNGCPTGWVNP